MIRSWWHRRAGHDVMTRLRLGHSPATFHYCQTCSKGWDGLALRVESLLIGR